MKNPEMYVYRVALFLSPGATVIGLSTLAASDGASAITAAEWVMAVVATITAAAAQAGSLGLDRSGARSEARRAADALPTPV